MVEPDDVIDYFASDAVVEHYARAAANLGLWRSEELLFQQYFKKEDRIIELGTGAGRIAFGLFELGYQHVLGTDYIPEMIQKARNYAQILDYNIPFKVCDAQKLPFEDNLYDGAIFGFNGLMQIPGWSRRVQAMREVLRIIRPGGCFIFTSHDRSLTKYRNFWEEEARRWQDGVQDRELIEFGDRYVETELGKMYINVPSREEVTDALKTAGFEVVRDHMRAQIANEPQEIREFSDECRFWVARKPMVAG